MMEPMGAVMQPFRVEVIAFFLVCIVQFFLLMSSACLTWISLLTRGLA
jgi:hypothetical protein